MTIITKLCDRCKAEIKNPSPVHEIHYPDDTCKKYLLCVGCTISIKTEIEEWTALPETITIKTED